MFNSKSVQKIIASLTLALLAGASQAGPVLLGSVNTTYGKSAGDKANYTSNSNSCVQAGSVTVFDRSSCGVGQFSDKFDFSGIAADSISSLKLTLTFSGTNDWWFDDSLAFSREDWNVRLAGSSTLFDMLNSDGSSTQEFNFTAANLDIFNSIISGGSFDLRFFDEAGANFSFNLMSAKLDVWGTPATAAVPEPSALALVGLALLGLRLTRRRSSQR